MQQIVTHISHRDRPLQNNSKLHESLLMMQGTKFFTTMGSNHFSSLPHIFLTFVFLGAHLETTVEFDLVKRIDATMDCNVLKTMNGLAISPPKSKSSPVAIQKVDEVYLNPTGEMWCSTEKTTRIPNKCKLPCIHSFDAISNNVSTKDFANQFLHTKLEYRQQESEIQEISSDHNTFENRFKPHNVVEDEDEQKNRSDNDVFTLPDAYFEIGEKVESDSKPVCRKLHVDFCRQSSIFRQNMSRSQKVDAMRNQRINYCSDENETCYDSITLKLSNKTQEIEKPSSTKPRKRRIRGREESIFFQGKFGKTRLVFCPEGNLRSAIRTVDRHPGNPRRNVCRTKANTRYINRDNTDFKSDDSFNKTLADETMHWIQKANPISSPTKSPMSTVDLCEANEVKNRNYFDIENDSDKIFFSTILSQV